MKYLKAKAMSDKLILGVTVHVQMVEHDLQEDTIMIQNTDAYIMATKIQAWIHEEHKCKHSHINTRWIYVKTGEHSHREQAGSMSHQEPKRVWLSLAQLGR